MDTFQKQPAEVLDYDADFNAFLAASGNDVLASATVTVSDPGINIDTFICSPSTGIVKTWLSGGVDGTTYEVYVTATTVGGRVKEHEFRIRVRAL